MSLSRALGVGAIKCSSPVDITAARLQFNLSTTENNFVLALSNTYTTLSKDFD